MKRLSVISAILLAGAVGCTAPAGQTATGQLPAILSPANYAKGVSALAAGKIGNTLIIAGGANFPDTPAAEGGSKAFHDRIFVLPDGADSWTEAGQLPRPTAYGAVFQLEDRIIIAGGAGYEGSYADVTELRLFESHCGEEQCDGLNGIFAVTTPLPPLPVPVEQAAAARTGRKLYIAGGLSGGAPSTGVYVCDLDRSGEWSLEAELPEPMVQPIAAATERYLYIWGGFDPAKKEAAGYGFRFDMQSREWSRIAGLPDGGTAVGSTAVQDSNGTMWVAGGVNREIFNAALRQPAEKNAEYLSHPAGYYRFRNEIYKFDPASESWSLAGRTQAAARAGAALVLSDDGLTIINGELKPGIRSAEINKLAISNQHL